MSEIAPLPVKVEPDPGESGLGFLLRVARANGLSLASLFEIASLPRSLWMSERAVLTLAQATEVDLEWLRSHSVITCSRDGHRCFEWRGQLWACPLSLRGTRPQVCPICLQEGRTCLQDWELSGAVVCVHHRCSLIDICGHCGKRLSWWRPAIDVCTCGHFIVTKGEEVVGELLVDWTETLLAKADRVSRPLPERDLPRWLGVLSADGLLAVGFAFGIRREQLERVSSAAARVPPSTIEMRAVIERAVVRLRRSGEIRAPCAMDLRMQVYEEGLRRLWHRNVAEADRNVAAGLLHWLGATRHRPRHSSRATTNRQGELFEFLASN